MYIYIYMMAAYMPLLCHSLSPSPHWVDPGLADRTLSPLLNGSGNALMYHANPI